MNPSEVRSFDKLEAKVDLLVAAATEHKTTHAIIEERLRLYEGNNTKGARQVVIQWIIPAGVVTSAVAIFESTKPLLAGLLK